MRLKFWLNFFIIRLDKRVVTLYKGKICNLIYTKTKQENLKFQKQKQKNNR